MPAFHSWIHCVPLLGAHMNIAEVAVTFGDMHFCKPQLKESIAAGKDGPSGGSRMAAGAGEAIAAHYPAQVCIALLL